MMNKIGSKVVVNKMGGRKQSLNSNEHKIPPLRDFVFVTGF